MQSDGLFSSRALRKISSPEELDQLMHVTSPRGWIALLALIMLIGIAITWCFAGSIPVTVSGSGILMRSHGITEAICMGDGQITEMNFRLGEEVKKDQILVKIDQPELEKRMTIKKKQLALLTAKKDHSAPDQRKIESLNMDIEDLSIDMEIKSYVRSPIDGIIVQKFAVLGDYVNTGRSIADIEDSSEDLICIVHVPVYQGEEIQPGMTVQVFPEIASRDEYGYIVGRVKYVSLYPQSRQSLMRYLKNEQLADMFAAKGPPLAIYVELEKNPKAPGGYRWSSSVNPKVYIQSGTLCSSKIIVNEVHPISLMSARPYKKQQ